MGGWLGSYPKDEMAAKGIFSFPVGAFDNGMRQIAGNRRPIARPEDLAGMKMRVPAGAPLARTFNALGAQPAPVNTHRHYKRPQTGLVDAPEKPLALLD